jgi:uncharacterized protein (TIGR03437 family)
MPFIRTPGSIAAGLLAACFAMAQSQYTLDTFAGSDEVGDGGPASAALLNHLEGVACDSVGNIYISDADDHRVRKIAINGVISTVAGTGHAGLSGDGGPAAAAQLNTPYGIAVDAAGNLYIADLGNHRIRRVDASGGIITIAGGGVTPAGEADGLPATDAALDSPRNVVAGPDGAVYFSDFGANRVYAITPFGLLARVAGSGDQGFSGDGHGALEAKLSSPAGLAFDSMGALYIADAGNGRIRRVFHGIIETLGDSGKPGASPSVAPMLPTGLAFDSEDNLFIADPAGAQVLRVTPDLLVTAFAQAARDLAVGMSGDLYVVSGPYLYERFRGGGVAEITGAATDHQFGDGGPARKARLNRPSAVARDLAGNVYVADTGNDRIRKIAPDFTISTIGGNGAAQWKAPGGVAVDSAGALYVADTGNNRIEKMNTAGLTIVAGAGKAGYSGDHDIAVRARLNAPSGLAFDSDGNLYIADTGNHAIRMVTPSGIITTIAGTGERGFSGDGGDPASARLDSPRGVAIGPSGQIYIADTGNGRVRRIVPANAFGPAVISSVPAGNASWRQPVAVAVDEYGVLYVSDAGDHRVYSVEPTGRVTAIAGTGAANFSGESGPANTMPLADPAGLLAAPGGIIYLCDSGNHRVRTLTPALAGGITNPPPAAHLEVANAASLLGGPVAPGEIVSLFGEAIGASEPVTADLTSGVAPRKLADVQVLVAGRAAPLFYVGPKQINAQIPYSIAGRGGVNIQVVAGGLLKAAATVQVADSAPGVFTIGDSGQAVALNQDGSFNSPENPADRGSIIVLYATGEGTTDPVSVEGVAAAAPAPSLTLPVTVRIGGYPAEIQYAGPAPGLIGLMQINARIPGGYAPRGVLPVTIEVGTAVTQAGVTIAVK